MILSVDLNKLHLIGDARSKLFNLFQQIHYAEIEKDIPTNLVLFLMDIYFIDKGICQIFLLLSDDLSYMLKEEKYSKCIYSHYSSRVSTIVSVENVKRKIGYSQIDPRVNSEIFIEIPLNNKLHIILNSEYTTCSLSNNEKKWFRNLIEIIGF